MQTTDIDNNIYTMPLYSMVDFAMLEISKIDSMKITKDEEKLIKKFFLGQDLNGDEIGILWGILKNLKENENFTQKEIKCYESKLTMKEILNNLGEALSNKQGTNYYYNAIEKDPKNRKARYNIGISHMYNRDYEKAITPLLYSELLAPNQISICYNIIKTFEGLANDVKGDKSQKYKIKNERLSFAKLYEVRMEILKNKPSLVEIYNLSHRDDLINVGIVSK